MRILSLIMIPAMLAGCAPAVAPEARSAQAQAKLETILAGKVAGQPMSCLPAFQRDSMITIDDNTVVFKNGRDYYVNNLRGGCNHLGSGFYTMVTRSVSPTLCSGEIVQVADLTSGAVVGSCTLGEFVPYRQP